MKIWRFTAAATVAAFCMSMVGCSFSSKDYTKYVKACLDCTYLGVTEEYMKQTDSTKEEAEAIYDSQVEYVAELICYKMDVDTEMINEGTMTGYKGLARSLMGKVKYTVEDAVKAGDSYHVTVVTEPIDFWDITFDPVDAYINDGFLERYAEATSDAAMKALEQEYAINVLEIITPLVDEISYKPAVNKIVEITEDDNLFGITDQEWLDIDDLLLDLNPNT